MPDDAPAPLRGLKVVELARILAGPWAGQVLADLGAEVIKVEAPEGDDTRRSSTMTATARPPISMPQIAANSPSSPISAIRRIWKWYAAWSPGQTW